MYYPYFFSSKFEMETIFKLKKEIDKGYILPIIEPFKFGRESMGILSKMITSNTPFILIANPTSQRTEKSEQRKINLIIDSLLKQKNSKMIIGLHIEDLEYCKDIIAQHKDKEIALFHKKNLGSTIKDVIDISNKDKIKYNFFTKDASKKKYHSMFKGKKKILLQNAFFKVTPNSKYKEHLDENFYNIHLKYKSLGFDGFGDFLTIGDAPNDSTRARFPSTVVIHYTYPKDKDFKNIRIKRFIGDIHKEEFESSNDGILKAMVEAKDFITEQMQSYFQLCEECKRMVSKVEKGEAYSSLGEIKKFSMLHHVYMILKLTNREI